MNKVREEFEEWSRPDFGLERASPNSEHYEDERTQDAYEAWQAAHALYTKETEPLKWRWDTGSESFCVGEFEVCSLECCSDGWRVFDYKGCCWLRGGEFEAAYEKGKEQCDGFLAKLRGEA